MMFKSLLVFVLCLVVLTGCGDEARVADGAAPDEVAPDGTAPQGESGTVTIRLESVQGFFIEGFEVGLKIEAADGELVDAILWSEFVQSVANPTIESYYTSVYKIEVPAGDLVVRGEVNIGMGPGPVVPDLSTDLTCELAISVEPDTQVDIEVNFEGTGDCLRLLAS